MFWKCSSPAQRPLLTLQEASARKIVYLTIKPDIDSLPLPKHLTGMLTDSYEKFHHLQLTEYNTVKLRNSYRHAPLTFKEDIALTEPDYTAIYQYPKTFQYLPCSDQWQHVVRYFFVKTNIFQGVCETFYLCTRCMNQEFQNDRFLFKKIRSHFTTSVEHLSTNFDTFVKLALCHNCLRTPIASILTESQCCLIFNRHYEAKCLNCAPPFSCTFCHHTTLKNIRWREPV